MAIKQYSDLSPEMQQRLLQKMSQFSDTDQFKIASKLKIPMEAMASEGVREVGPIDAMQGLADTGAEATVDKLGRKLPAPVSAAVGLGVSMLPDAAIAAAGGLRHLPKAAKNLGYLGDDVVRGGKAVGSGIMKAGDAVFGDSKETAILKGKQALASLQERLTAQAQAAATIPSRNLAREAELTVAKNEYGKAIGKAEELGGFQMKDTPEEFVMIMKDPKSLNKMSKTLRTVGETPTDKLMNTDPVSLNYLRKFAQTFREVGPEVPTTIKANIKMGGGKAIEALGKIEPAFKAAMDEWGKVANQLGRLEDDVVKQKAAMTTGMLHTRLAIRKTQRLNDIAIAAGAKRDLVRKVLGNALGIGGIGYGLLSFLGGKK